MPDTPPSAAGLSPRDTAPRASEDRDRFLTFAFASAEILVEVSAGGQITFATGAVQARFGCAADELLGRSALDLAAPHDRRTLTELLAVLATRSRLPPTLLRVAGPGNPVMTVSALCRQVAGRAGFCLTFAQPPAAPDQRPPDAETLFEEVQRRIASGSSGEVGLFELPEGTASEVIAALQESCGSAELPVLAAEVAPGRFGLLPQPGTALPDLAEISTRLEAEFKGPVQSAVIPLSACGLTPDQTTRALRHALKVFSRSGVPGMAKLGAPRGLDSVVAHVAKQAAGVRRVIAERRFQLTYQPIVSLETRAVHHYEVLIRPAQALPGGDASPATLVTTAEAIGLTAELDLAVVAEALAALAVLRVKGRIAVNLSGLSVQSVAFRDALMRQIAAQPHATTGLMVELTESAEIEDEEAAAQTLSMLRAKGIPVCIDDFGAGAAAFRYLKSFPVDYVKVDGSYVAAAVKSERDRAFVASMVELSRAVGASVVAERIETEVERQLMQSLGVEYGQGWLFGRPGALPASSGPTQNQRPKEVSWAGFRGLAKATT